MSGLETKIIERSRVQTRASQMRLILVDCVLWSIAFCAAWTASLFFTGGSSITLNLAVVVVYLSTVISMYIVGRVLGLYAHAARVWPGSRTEDVLIFLSSLVAGGTAFAVNLLLAKQSTMPKFLPLLAAVLMMLLATTGRNLWRWMMRNTREYEDFEKVVVYGTGVSAAALMASMGESDKKSRYSVVGVLAEDQRRSGTWVHGMRAKYVDLADIQDFALSKDASVLILATDYKPAGDDVTFLQQKLEEVGIRLLLLPSLEVDASSTSVDGSLIDKVRSIEVADLLGRDVVKLDEEELRRGLKGKKILVTGAGGSIGSEICRQVHRFEPAELIMVDRDEGGLHATQLSLTGTALLNGQDTVLLDIRDLDAVQRVVNEHRPDMIFHAAALKHMPLLENHPLEAVKTNVLGTWNVLQAAASAKVNTVVNISTDKAANPTSVLGESKRIAERLTAFMGGKNYGKWVSVRFGNVFGSRGSVIETFSRQIEKGGPVTITAPDVDRYFMSIPEASQLVLEAALVGRTGSTLVLDMGEPIKIVTVAKRIMELFGKEVGITYTGLRPGEKLSEELIDDTEEPRVGEVHPLITEVRVTALKSDDGFDFPVDDEESARSWLMEHGESKRSQQQEEKSENLTVSSM